MDTMNAIRKRKSFRGPFTDTPVSREDLTELLEAGYLAPSGCNLQTTWLIGVDDPELLAGLADIYSHEWAKGATAAILLIGSFTMSPSGVSYHVHDYCAAAENIYLAAADKGLGTVWIEGQIRGERAEKMGVLTFLALTLALGLTACSKSQAGAADSSSQTATQQSPASDTAGQQTAASDTTEPQTEALSAENSSSGSAVDSTAPSAGQIYLFGEEHGVEKILNKEVEIWNDYYHNQNMRHLFVELPYYTAEYLNLWMKSDSDEILDAIYDDWDGSAAHNPYIRPFYKAIKEKCPETIFHGTDVGHQYFSTGERYLAYLKENGQENSEQYQFTQKVIEQGKYYYDHSDDVYRENMMVENFIQEYDKLNNIDIMGIYGGAHTNPESLDNTGTIPCMANQLKEHYGDVIHSENLVLAVKDDIPVRTDKLTVNGKEYEASYFGKQDLTGFKDYLSREFWRLDNAYDDFKGCALTGEQLPYGNYPMRIETGQVFVIDYTKTDGSVTRQYYRSDGNQWNGSPSTQGITVE